MRSLPSTVGLMIIAMTVGCGDASKAKQEKPKPASPPPVEQPTPVPKGAKKALKVQGSAATGPGSEPAKRGDALSASVVLPPASRVFTVDLDGDGVHEILGSKAGTLWAHRIHKSGGTSALWSVEGEGTVHRVLVTPKHGSTAPRLLVARGVGRGRLKAPLILEALDPMAGTGVGKPLLKIQGPRNEPAHLSISDVDRDGQPEIAFAYFKSKYFVQTHHFELDGAELKSSTTAEAIRMGTSRTFGDVNGAGGADEIIGRVYGDARGLPGDLKINLGNGHMTVVTDKGVRGLLYAQIGDEKAPSLYFADGWVANYGKEAKAVLKQLTWTAQGFSSTLVGQSAKEFTFFDLRAVDINGDGKLEIAARGNAQMTIFERSAGQWSQWTAARFEPVINVAIGRGGDNVWRVFVPNDAGVRAMTVVRP